MNNLHIIRLEKEGEKPLEAQGPYSVLSELVAQMRNKGYKVVLKRA